MLVEILDIVEIEPTTSATHASCNLISRIAINSCNQKLLKTQGPEDAKEG